MSLLLLDELTGNIPARDSSQKPSVIAAIQDVSSSARFLAKAPPPKISTKGSVSLARTRRQISRVSRTELEDGFLRLHDENLLLKEFAQKQEDRIKRLGTKLSKLSHERSQANGKSGAWSRSSGRNLDLMEDLEDTQERVWELERRNEGLRNRLHFYKQQLQLQGCNRHCPYGYVSPRVDTGLRRVNTAAGRVPERLRKGMRVRGPEVRPTHTAPPRYGDHIADVSRAETERLTHSLVMAELEMDSETPSSLQGRDTDPESSRSQQRYHEVQARRTAIQDNVELIRLQKLVRVKNSELATAKAQLVGLQESYETHLHQNQEALRTASEALLAQVEELNSRLKDETQKALALENQLEALSPLQGTLKELQERVRDLQKEKDLLKEDYDKLLDSCINTAQQNLDEVPQKDNAAPLEEQLSWMMMEKQQLQEQLEDERARNEELKQEVKQLLQLAQDAKDSKEVECSHEKAAILENPSAAILENPGVAILENPNAAILENPSVEQEPPSTPAQLEPGRNQLPYMEFLSKSSDADEAQRSLKRRLHETEAAHAETILELEKTRDMLILQHRINRDYQVELDAVALRAEQEKKDHEEKEQSMARLLDLRSARIHQLEAQLKDVAYGTQTLLFHPRECEVTTEGDPDRTSPRLQRGENLLELHISGAVLSSELLRLLGDAEPTTFCTYAFYDFEMHSTPLARGPRPRYDFTSQYVVRAEPFFLQYLQGAAARLDLHLASAVEHTTLASCWLRFGEVLGKGEQVHATAALHGPNGEDYGFLEYWVRLRFPIEQILRLHRQRTKALGYLSAGVLPRAPAAQEGVTGPGWNEFSVRIEGCAGLRSRWLGSQPSPYAMYQFFTFPDHDTVIIPSSNNPHFGDLRTFPLRVTPELHYYLLRESLCIYVFDDEDTEAENYLGKAQIPLLPLAHGRSVTGDFVLTDPMGKAGGSISLSLEWKLRYVPPEDYPQQTSVEREADRRSLELQIEKEKASLQSQERKAPSPPARLRSQPQRKKPRLSLPEPDRHLVKRAESDNGTREAVKVIPTSQRERHVGEEVVDGAIQKVQEKQVALEELKEEEEETPAGAEEERPVRLKDSEVESRAPTVAEEEQLERLKDSEVESRAPTVAEEEQPERLKDSEVESRALTVAEEEQPERLKDSEVESRAPTVSEEVQLERLKDSEVESRAPTVSEEVQPERLKDSEVESRAPTVAEEEQPERLKDSEVESRAPTVAEEEQPERLKDSEVESRAPTVSEEEQPARLKDSEVESRAPTEAEMPKDAASEESASDAPTTESDEVVVATATTQEPPELRFLDRIRVEVVSLSLRPDSEPVADEAIQQLYVEYRFPGVPLAETETPFSLRKPLGGQEIYFHFSKVIKLDPDPASIQRQLLFSMLAAEEPPHNQLQFVVVSEPLPGAGGECDDVGFAYLDLRQILLTGSDILQQNLRVVSSRDPDTSIGLLRVSVEAATALRLIYWAGKKNNQ